ncbi:hypothetical protein CFC21_060022 [Triticum aestivum]|uniref:Protein kinase domain-containing protein n=2 Tax=Triticum aestivum TaxID=4565 RepID=A0A3B6JBN6_WHEAT|nr:hypothetical protein CFC21_060022 [Triticum aestivum]
MPLFRSPPVTTTSPMHHHHLVFLPTLLLVVVHFICAAASSSTSPNTEVAFLFSWLGTSPARPPDWSPASATPCRWSHVGCDAAGAAVTSITFQSVHLAVPLTAGLCAALPGLLSFIVSKANLTGGIPEDLALCRRLAVLDLSDNSLTGPVPASLGNLTASLKNLLLFDNRLSGELPASLGGLRLLESFRAGGNSDLSGPIPDSFSKLSSLVVLGLAETKISGPLRPSLGALKSLQTLFLDNTMLSGSIPPELAQCSNLIGVYLYQNALSGPIPPELGALPRLQYLLLWGNALTGHIPESFGNLTSLVALDLSINSISGSIPAALGRLAELQELRLTGNNLTGTIPVQLANATAIMRLQLDANEISGLIPPELGRSLPNLQVLYAWQNRLEGAIPATLVSMASLQGLDLSYNHLTGFIPPGLFLLRNLTRLMLMSNELSGVIPPEIGKAASLVRLRLSGNHITGVIPAAVGGMNSIVFLDLASNRLTGPVPAELGNCSQLQMLDLRNNTITGALPESLAGVHDLQKLDVSHNQFVGVVPKSFGKLAALSRLVLANNALSGSIPAALGRCHALELLDLSDNRLSGGIPDELCGLSGLGIALNLSHNNLTGAIPARISELSRLSVLDLSYNAFAGSLEPLARMDNLVTLNVSRNNFSGHLPDTKLFRQLPASSLAGNPGLCTKGGDVCFAVDADGRPITHRVHGLKLAVALPVTATVAIVLGMMGILLRAREVGGKVGGSDSEAGVVELGWPWQFMPFQKVSLSVDQVVRSLVDANIIGKGVSGVVYRVSLISGETVAVKKLWPAATCNNAGRDSFTAEVRTLGSIRHRNIVRFLGCCCNRSTRERLLMYDYMANGSLGAVLHKRQDHGGGAVQLEWDVRYQIVLDSAQGLAYLHHGCSPPIVHRDIKANNILIGLDFKAYIADFGLAKLVHNGADFSRSSYSIAGSCGYIAPEYGHLLKITEKSDVYSYGVVMLEVLTGKHPIDPTIPDGLHVVDWVRQHKGGAGVLDPALQGQSKTEVEEMLWVMGVAMLCVNAIPDQRPAMKDVVAMLGIFRSSTRSTPSSTSGSRTLSAQ